MYCDSLYLFVLSNVSDETGAWGGVVVKALRYWSDGPGIDPRWCHWGFFPWYPRQNNVPWGRLSLWKWVPGISPGVKVAGAFGWRPTTLVVPKRQENPGTTYPEPLGSPRPVAEHLNFIWWDRRRVDRMVITNPFPEMEGLLPCLLGSATCPSHSWDTQIMKSSYMLHWSPSLLCCCWWFPEPQL